MKTVYANTRHPRLIKWSCIAIGAAGLTCLVLYILQKGDHYLFSAFYSLAYLAIFFGIYKLNTYTIDDEADTITFSQQKEFPLRLSDIKSVIYKESKKGRFRYLFIHDSGKGFLEIRTSKDNADSIVAQILKANPGATVEHAHYL